MAEGDNQTELMGLTVDIVTAFVANNSVRSDDLPKLITETHAALAGLSAKPAAEEQSEEFTPAVSVRKSLAKRDVILSMIDGKPYRTLKRHLSVRGLTPDEYRARYKLPASYPMVAPAYSEQRREVAKRLGLGRKKGQPAPARKATAGKTGAAKAAARKPRGGQGKRGRAAR